jgi:hypothetical protein
MKTTAFRKRRMKWTMLRTTNRHVGHATCGSVPKPAI